MLHKVTFECETITPMFLAGANQSTAELRAPSIKGALRFWWRAMNGHLPVNELRKKEAEIFGGVGEKEGKSSFAIIVRKEQNDNIGTHLRSDYRLNWSFSRGKLVGRDAGVGYLLYSTVLPRRERPFFFAPTHRETGFTFTLTFTALNKRNLQHVIAAFWSLTFLGGLGTRSRRGGGNFRVVNIEDEQGIASDSGIKFYFNGNNQEAFLQWLVENFDTAKHLINEGNPTDFVSEYSNLSLSRVIISNEKFQNWREALNDIGVKYQDFRFNHRGEIFETAVFGLPVVHRRLTVEGRLERERIRRRSSPLIIKILNIGNQYYWMVLRLAGQFLPPGGVIQAGRTRKPDYRLIDEFWNTLKHKGEEIILSLPDTLKEQIHFIQQSLSPKKLILFGSRARGDFHNTSDIDLAVETDSFIEDYEFNGALDIVDLRTASDSLKNIIAREGVSLL